MKIGFLYAGQGAQHVGMGKDLYEAYPEFREVFDNVKLDFDVKECCFDGPIEKLGQTRYTQPCMVAFAVGVTKFHCSKGCRTGDCRPDFHSVSIPHSMRQVYSRSSRSSTLLHTVVNPWKRQ